MKKWCLLLFLCVTVLCTSACMEEKIPTPTEQGLSTMTSEAEIESAPTTKSKAQVPASNLSAELILSVPAALRDTFLELGQIYEKKTENLTLTFRFEEPGQIFSEVEKGAPIDIFVTGNEKQKEELEAAGLFYQNQTVMVGMEYIVLLANPSVADLDFSALSDERILSIAICDPASNRYGILAKDILSSLRMTDKLVIMESPEALMSYTENTEGAMGILALAELPDRELDVFLTGIASKDWYEPVLFYAGVLELGGQTALAEDFLSFLQEEEAQELLQKAGHFPEAPQIMLQEPPTTAPTDESGQNHS